MEGRETPLLLADACGTEAALGRRVGAVASQSRGDDMRLNTTIIPVGTLVTALVLGACVAEAGQRDDRGRDRNGRESQGRARQRDSAPPPAARAEGQDRGGERREQIAPSREQGARPQFGARGDESQARGGRVAPPEERRLERPPAPAPESRAIAPSRREYDLRDSGRPVERRRDDDRRQAYGNGGYRDNDRYRDNDGYRRGGSYRGYDSPRYQPARPLRPHYYGSGGNLSVYFGWGNGYLFGAPWSGRVYGYVTPRGYSARMSYGDVRLQVRPRDAAVYVDGYYAGIVDDFDGVFQRLTLEVGPHQIELDEPGLEPQVFDIYVDPARTVDIRADLYRD